MPNDNDAKNLINDQSILNNKNATDVKDNALKRINRGRIKRSERYIAALVSDLSSGRVMLDDFPEEDLAKLREFLKTTK